MVRASCIARLRDLLVSTRVRSSVFARRVQLPSYGQRRASRRGQKSHRTGRHFGHLGSLIPPSPSNRTFVVPLIVVMAFALLLSACSPAPQTADRCQIPYRAVESVGTCPGTFSEPTLVAHRPDGETWTIVVPSKNGTLIAGALGKFWVEHPGKVLTVFASGDTGSLGIGYDRGVLFDRNGTLTFGICSAWLDFGPLIGEVCNDQLRFDVRAPSPPSTGPTPVIPTPTAKQTPAPGDVFLTGAGYIASCTSRGDEATAAILARTPGTNFTAGDNAYESWTGGQYGCCYGPAWGQFKERTRPAIGNHE